MPWEDAAPMYRTIESSFWSDPKVRGLDPDAKLAFLYLITNDRAHVSGIYYLPTALFAHETGLSPDRVSGVVKRLIASGTISVDHDRSIFWVRNLFRYQGRGEKNIASATKHLATLHNSPLINEFCSMYRSVKTPKNASAPDRVSGVGRHSSQEQEQEQELNTPLPPKGGVEMVADPNAEAKEVCQAYHDRVTAAHARRVSSVVRTMLQDHVPKAEMIAAITNFGEWHRREQTSPDKRPAVTTFFTEIDWRSYVGEVPPPVRGQPVEPAISGEDRALMTQRMVEERDRNAG